MPAGAQGRLAAPPSGGHSNRRERGSNSMKRIVLGGLVLLAVVAARRPRWQDADGVREAAGGLSSWEPDRLSCSRSSRSGSRRSTTRSGSSITYSATGSGAGIAQITARTVDFGASDAPLSPDQLTACKGCVVIPWALAGMSVPYNIPGLNGRLAPQRRGAREHLPRQHHQLERAGDQGAEPEAEPARSEDHARLPLGRLGLDVRLHGLPRRRSARSGRARSAGTRASTSRPARAHAGAPASPES